MIAFIVYIPVSFHDFKNYLRVPTTDFHEFKILSVLIPLNEALIS